MNTSVKEKVDMNNNWFKKNIDQLNRNKDKGEFVIINNEKVISYFHKWEDAMNYADKKEISPGFIIKNINDYNKTNTLGFIGLVI